MEMSKRKCPKCGSIEGVVFAPSGEVLSCLGCDKVASANAAAEQRIARKDEIDEASLLAASRSTTKDVIDLGAKVAGVTVAAAALFKANERTQTPTERTPETLPCRTIEPLPVAETYGPIGGYQSWPTVTFLFKDKSALELESMARETGLQREELTGIALGLLKCLIEEMRRGNKVIISTSSKKPVYELLIPLA